MLRLERSVRRDSVSAFRVRRPAPVAIAGNGTSAGCFQWPADPIDLEALVIQASRTGTQFAQRHQKFQRRDLDAGQMRQCQRRIEHAVYLHRPSKLQILQDTRFMVHGTLIADPLGVVGGGIGSVRLGDGGGLVHDPQSRVFGGRFDVDPLWGAAGQHRQARRRPGC